MNKALPPSRELDALIAEKVMGYTFEQRKHFSEWASPEVNGARSYGLPPYSTDIAAAWSVVEKLRDKDFLFRLGSRQPVFSQDKAHQVYVAGFYSDKQEFNGLASSAPHAICLAALKAAAE